MTEQDRIDRFREAFPGEVHVNGRFFYDPASKRFWHWCIHVRLVGSMRPCNRLPKSSGVIVCAECHAEIQESEFPAAFQLYLKLF